MNAHGVRMVEPRYARECLGVKISKAVEGAKADVFAQGAVCVVRVLEMARRGRES